MNAALVQESDGMLGHWERGIGSSVNGTVNKWSSIRKSLWWILDSSLNTKISFQID